MAFHASKRETTPWHVRLSLTGKLGTPRHSASRTTAPLKRTHGHSGSKLGELQIPHLIFLCSGDTLYPHRTPFHFKCVSFYIVLEVFLVSRAYRFSSNIRGSLSTSSVLAEMCVLRPPRSASGDVTSHSGTVKRTGSAIPDGPAQPEPRSEAEMEAARRPKSLSIVQVHCHLRCLTYLVQMLLMPMSDDCSTHWDEGGVHSYGNQPQLSDSVLLEVG